MATIQGPGGSITLPTGYNAKIAAWSATILPNVVDTSGFVDAGNHTTEVCDVLITGGCVGTAISGSSNVPSSGLGASPAMAAYQGTITLTPSSATGNTYTFVASFTAIALNRPYNGKYDVAYNFTNSGPITGL